jgi:hypothetical protein
MLLRISLKSCFWSEVLVAQAGVARTYPCPLNRMCLAPWDKCCPRVSSIEVVSASQ